MAGFNVNRQAMIIMIMPRQVVDLVSKLSRWRNGVASGQLGASIGALPFATREDPIFCELEGTCDLTLIGLRIREASYHALMLNIRQTTKL